MDLLVHQTMQILDNLQDVPVHLWQIRAYAELCLHHTGLDVTLSVGLPAIANLPASVTVRDAYPIGFFQILPQIALARFYHADFSKALCQISFWR